MAEVIIMPKLGFNMSEGKLVKWYKAEGDEVKKGENLFSIETDKTNMDIEATNDGTVRKLLIDEGDQIPVTLPIAIVATKDEDITAALEQALKDLGKDNAAENTATSLNKAEAAPASSSNHSAGLKNTNDYEVLVIGGGPGGYVAAIKAAQMGKKTAIVEKAHFGGTCLNVGCIPTKALLRSAEALNEVKESATFGVTGVDIANAKLDLKRVQERKKQVITQLVGGVQGLLKGNGVTLINGEGNLIDKNTLEAAGKKYTADYIIIATGSDVKNLPITISPKRQVLTSKEMLELSETPKTMTIIGGGVIGIEFAYFLASIGTKVTVIEFLDRILPMVDEEITAQVAANLVKMGITIHTGAKVTEITDQSVRFEKAGEVQEVEAEKVLMAVGRAPRLDGIPCEALGIKTERGAIVTDECLKTSVSNIYAIGDVNGKAMLAHTASMEGIVAVENICGHKSAMDYGKIPSAIYVQPEIASVGLTEAEAKAKYGQVKVGKFPLLANGKAKVAGEERGLVKVILEPKYGEIVGVHMYCIHATDMISEAVVAMKLEGTAEEVANAIHPHPTVSEVMHEAMHAATGKAIHFL
ncbi:dihydrolipoyl dehydrogenase [Clostridium aminobutyricum]|uniref:Dihydrolipoyl dehydrogenase n=1 Tax=Clostridium aminobutyricum TaxID=33953 RepID=A0A939IJ21_CLOAM|nr:dihydrolipoyl dehydrogenase [Clostridium aminobutyricum]MBN7773114.1 dihydrolipoyl dehydrogenase [Clostridium aminobutyricum]